METVVKALVYVHTDQEANKQWNIAVAALGRLTGYEKAQVWISLSNRALVHDKLQTLVLKTQYKQLFRFALREAERSESCCGDTSIIEHTLHNSIRLCKAFRVLFDDFETSNIMGMIENDDDSSFGGGAQSARSSGAGGAAYAIAPSRRAVEQPQDSAVLQRVTAIEQSIANVNNRMDSIEHKLDALLARPPAPAAAFPVERVVALEQGLQRNTNEVQKLEQAMNALTTTLNTTLANIRRETAEALQRTAAPRRPDDPLAVAEENSASSVGSGGSPARRREGVRRRDSDGGARRGPEPVWNPANGSIDHRRADNALLDQGSASVPGRPGVQRGMASTFGWPDSPPWSPI